MAHHAFNIPSLADETCRTISANHTNQPLQQLKKYLINELRKIHCKLKQDSKEKSSGFHTPKKGVSD
jgi:hypothetical protein